MKKKIIIVTIILTVIIVISAVFAPKYIRIIRMANFVNEKYGLDVQPFPVIYGKEDKTRHEDMFGFGFTRDIPYYAIFDLGYNEDIVVVERDGVLSDDHQMEYINLILADYISKITGYESYHVDVRSPSNGNVYDEKISRFIQTKFPQLVTEENVAEFLTGICEESATELVIYIRDQENREKMLEDVTTKLFFLADIETVKSLIVYFYSGDSITVGYTDIRGNCTNDEGELDFTGYDYIFETVFAVNKYENPELGSFADIKPNTFVLRAEMILDRGYTAGHGMCKNEYEYNGWVIGEF